jgi:hypothetical protein
MSDLIAVARERRMSMVANGTLSSAPSQTHPHGLVDKTLSTKASGNLAGGHKAPGQDGAAGGGEDGSLKVQQSQPSTYIRPLVLRSDANSSSTTQAETKIKLQDVLHGDALLVLTPQNQLRRWCAQVCVGGEGECSGDKHCDWY